MNTLPLTSDEKAMTVYALRAQVDECLEKYSAAIRAELRDSFGVVRIPVIHVKWAVPDDLMPVFEKIVGKVAVA